MPKNNKTSATLVSQSNSTKNVLLFQYTCIADGHVSKTLLPRRAIHQSLIRLCPDVQYLTLLYTIFDKKCTPLRFVQEKV